MNPPPAPRWLVADDRRLFSLLHRPAGTVRGGVLFCAPLLHEHARSYRLFALLADVLAGHGIVALRFDYYGTGDSDGADAAFTLHDACSDSVSALAVLATEVGDAPLAVLGVRAGCIPACHVSRVARVDALWLWQPVTHGASYLDDLRRRDAEQRSTRQHSAHAASNMTLMGFPYNAALPDELRAAHADVSAPGMPRDITVLDAAERVAPYADAQRIALDDALHEWVGRMNMGRFPHPPLRAIGSRLAASLGQR